MKLFMIPFAGGSCYSYKPLEQMFDSTISTQVLELPGRGKRMPEPFLETTSEAVEDICSQIVLENESDFAIFGHSMGAKKLEEVLEWCREINAKSLTVYAFSTENFSRTKEEKEKLFSIFKDYYNKLMEKAKNKKNKEVRVKFLGDLGLFPKDVEEICRNLEEKTKDNAKYLLQFCFGYGGRREIISAVKKMIQDSVDTNKIDEDLFEKYLYTDIKPDLVIRTSGEKRLSNFLTWQTIYSELFFVDTFWPDFSKKEFLDIISNYHLRNKRNGS